MEINEHALKRLNILIGQEKAIREVRFMHRFILSGSEPIRWNHGLYISDVRLFAVRCQKFNIRFLGIETHMDGPFPIYVFCFEDFPKEGEFWYRTAVAHLQEIGVTNFLLPTIDVPEEILLRYLL